MEKIKVDKQRLEKYLLTRELSGLSRGWLLDVQRCLRSYLKSLNWVITEQKSLNYFKKLQTRYSLTQYRKQLYQIRKFLLYLGIDWAKNIKPPAEPEYIPKRVSLDDIKATLSLFNNYDSCLKLKALVHLGKSSGLRADELYQLHFEDIDIENCKVYVNHRPDNGQTTKTKKSRISFFDEDAKEALINYFSTIIHYKNSDNVFSRRQCQNQFVKAPIRVKHLRKYFSQKWDRCGGPTSIKKILMGHSTRRDVDLMHYNCQSEEDLKRIYDKIMK